MYNQLLSGLASTLQDDGVNAQIIDYAAVSNAFSEDPTGFGVFASLDDFLIDGSPFDSDQVGFWDELHPTEVVHQAWGAYSAFVMEGGSTSSLSDFSNFSILNNGNNAVFANGGNDFVSTRGGSDIAFGGTGNDILRMGWGDDIASGGSGNDNIRGQSGDDILAGGVGDDIIRGGSGNDVLIDGQGSDTVRGGSGDDVFVFVQDTLDFNGDAAITTDVFRGGSGTDTLYLVLDDATFDEFQNDGFDPVLDTLGIDADGIEAILAIDGRDQVEITLGGFDWFQDADYWGLVPAPTQTPDLLLS